MSGRGLGFTGGTIDKLEAFPGLRVDLPAAEFVRQLREIGIVITGQSADLAPADGRLYALRDVTGTVPSLPLIASSIMSKKLAAGANVIVLDVKVGSGAFMRTPEAARELASTMVGIGQAAGRQIVAYVTDMSQPLGLAVGNALEIAEAADTLQGNGPPDLVQLATTLAGEMLFLAGAVRDRDAGEAMAERALADGTGLEKLAAMVRAQGGDERCLREPQRLPGAPLQRELPAERAGVVARLDARTVAQAALALGAGRQTKGDTIDPSVGLVLGAKVGHRVEPGQPLATLHAGDEQQLQAAQRLLQAAYLIADRPVEAPPLIHERVSGVIVGAY
jgi:pyrimidine-nucleoside phosphorylase